MIQVDVDGDIVADGCDRVERCPIIVSPGKKKSLGKLVKELEW